MIGCRNNGLSDNAVSATARISPPGLLVSVRDAAEALNIADLPLDVLDLKEPRNGPLGPCDPEVWQACVEQVPFSGAWSIALGESETALQLAKHVPPEVAFAKAGPASLPNTSDLTRLWEGVRNHLHDSTRLVAVAYADHESAWAISPEETIQLASRVGITTVLIDTFGKTGSTSMEVLGGERMARLVNTAADSGCDVVLAGGLRLEMLPAAIALGVKRVGVRGDLCIASRTGTIDRQRLERWLAVLSRQAPTTSFN